MTEKTFNGWTNWATWNVALWVDNDYGLYHFRKECSGPAGWCFESAQAFCLDVFENGTPDMDDPEEMNLVNYQEIANAWNGEQTMTSPIDSGLDFFQLETDSEAYMGKGIPTEYPSDSWNDISPVLEPPCIDCDRWLKCESSEQECKAFRSFCNTGQWKVKDIGRLLR